MPFVVGVKLHHPGTRTGKGRDHEADARTARRLYELFEPICLVTYCADECNEEITALGHRTYWDGYFASRAAPLGRVPAQVVHAAFYSFADGEAARHIPRAWATIPPEASVAARERGSGRPFGGSSATSWQAPRAWCAPPT
jgi:hypothetical protein